MEKLEGDHADCPQVDGGVVGHVADQLRGKVRLRPQKKEKKSERDMSAQKGKNK